MNEREKLEMVKMCVDALLEGKSLEMFSCGKWHESTNIPGDVLSCILEDGTIYRIAKPAHKVQYRLYKWYTPDHGGGVSTFYKEQSALPFINAPSFRGWIGGWQEVEVEE